MKRVLEGSQAVAEAVRLARVGVISAYPITPQTHIVETLSELCAQGRMNARFLRVESEHSALASLIGSATTGARVFTATSGQGLALMHEVLHWTSGARLPIVMAEVNRALAPGWNIWIDQTDSLAQRDTGWIQFYCESGQEVLDTVIQAYRLGEAVNLPVMVVLDAFFLSHTYEPVDVPEQEEVDRFLPPFVPRFQADPDNPCAFGPLVTPAVYMEMRHNIAQAMEEALRLYPEIEGAYESLFGRRYGVLEALHCEESDIVLVTTGTVTSTCRQLLEDLRREGEKVGLLKLRLFRPFPVEDLRRHLKGVKKVAVIDRNFSFGASGIFAQEIRAALCNERERPVVFGFIAGIGGRDVTEDVLKEIYRKTKEQESPESESIWMALQEVPHGT